MRDPHRGSRGDAHGGERRQEGWDADTRRQETVDEADQHAGGQPGQHAAEKTIVVNDDGGDHGGVGDGADRKIDLARRQYEGHGHGVRCVEDPALLSYLADTRLPLTVCPLQRAAQGV